MAEIPYWTIWYDDAGPRVPWSGEAVPIESPGPGLSLPTLPRSIPSPGTVIQFIGQGEHAVAADVWNWIKTTAGIATSGLNYVAQATVADVVNIVEPYVGAHVQAAMSYVTEITGWADTGMQNINAYASDVASILFGDVYGIDRLVTALEGDVLGIEDVTLPEMFKTLFGAIDGVYADLVGGIDLVKSWAIDNIYSPLDAEIRHVEAEIPVWAEGALNDAKAYADNLVHSQAALEAAALAGVAGAVAAATAWIDDCGEPMCQVQGPKTDLGKLFKALQLAADAALLAELANMDETQLIALIQSLAGRTAAAIDFVNSEFVLHGQTIGNVISDAIGANL